MSTFYTGLRKRVVLLSCLLIVLTWIASSLATRSGIEQASKEQLAQRAQAVAWLMLRAASQTDEPVTGDALIRQLNQIGESLGETMSYEFGRSSGDQALRSSSFPDLSEEAVDGFSRHSQGDERWRVFTAVSEDQQTWSRVAFTPAEPKPLTEMLLLTLQQPLVWAITLLGLLAIAIQNRCFTPLKKIEDALANQDLLNPRPLALDPARLPRDVRPLVTQLDRILDQTKNLLEEQRTFAYGVGHELRTPLAGCLSQVQVAQRIEDPSRLKQSLAKAERALLQMTQLVDQLLLLARTDPSAPLENPSRITLSALVQESIERRTVTAQREGVVLKWRVDGPHDSEIEAKPELVRTLLTNLIDNAIRYSPRGGEILTRVNCSDDRWLVLSVSDQGSGIDAKESNQIFSPFYQSETGKSSGLGLAIVRAIVKAHGGDVSAHRRPMLGTEIRVVLPRA
ncbi:sensor histidine kinase [Halomonas sp. YLB-10]|uniref:sensor histidine kinase n=1 Tax=Halomonas sp. YLB-10 TaxID=2483111 RepID=UPI000F5DEEAC|nr:HAMP domain-containing sensor histidine kinase [Halomonas sp. YLB-10]RQW72471.1 sensor histidine kinase [Halomonas sp. YLB-10]